MSNSAHVGVVVIGRNEGERLRRCLLFPELRHQPIVYVDSGSEDGSPSIALELHVPLIRLQPPFSAARARNIGFEWLLTQAPAPEFVQFVDGDSELRSGWLGTGSEYLRKNDKSAAVCGNLRELHPEASVFNRLCDIEWRLPNGEIDSSGGIAMFRSAALQEVKGFREDLIAGEEPDLCFRLRQHGWSINKIDVEMAVHDAAMTRLSQWWARNKRSGYATAQALALRGGEDKTLLRKVLSNVFWSVPLSWPFAPLLWLRTRRQNGSAYATHIVAGKLPHLLGQLNFWVDRVRGKKSVLIEHK